jgi:hypothetical protein
VLQRYAPLPLLLASAVTSFIPDHLFFNWQPQKHKTTGTPKGDNHSATLPHYYSFRLKLMPRPFQQWAMEAHPHGLGW